ncbi:hypothetical protein HYV43_06325 [Candidatus Micrarchaeota archaeon]|nr:hypothetical protein [Candidatus Micrarchaeota archaeon]
MPHKCVRCSSIYPNNSPELMRGCTCGSRVFLFLRDESNPSTPLSIPPTPSASLPAPAVLPSPASIEPSEPVAGTSPVSSPVSSDYGWLEDELAFLSKDKPVSVEVDAVENLRILEKGAYEIDLPSLFKGEPLVIKSDQHVYYVKLPQPKE